MQLARIGLILALFLTLVFRLSWAVTYPQVLKSPVFQHVFKQPHWYHFDTIILMAMTLRLTAEEEQILGRLASQLGTSKQKALIEAMKMVEQKTAKKRKLDEALQFVLSNDKELMQRLADA